MRIFYDGTIYSIQKAGGINRYFSNLIKRLPSNFKPVLNTFYFRKNNYPTHCNLKTFYFPPIKPRRISYKIGKKYFSNSIKLNKFNLIHPTYYHHNHENIINNKSTPVIVTVYDMIHEFFPELIDSTGQEAEVKRKAILSADAIICISENTKNDLLKLYSLPEEKITVTHLASEIDTSFSHGTESVPSTPYYLYVGSRASYKNFDSLLYAFAKVISVESSLQLCVVGSPFTNEEIKLITALKLNSHIKHYYNPSDRHLAKLYRCSLGFVYPSFYEGFGIPPLEAMSCGTVAIASNCSSIPEVVGDAGILFDPKANDDLVDILISLAQNPIKREDYIEQGFRRAKLFSWDKTVEKTVEIYKSVCKQ